MKRFRLISGESRGVPDADKFNWSACILCQDTSKSEKLQCPADSKRGDVGAGYESLAINLLRFHELGELPAYVCISALDDGYGIASTLLNRRAKWHKTCRDCFNSTKLERLEKRKAVSSASSCNVDTAFESELTPHCSWTEEPVQRLTRSVLSTSHDMADKICFFCEQIKHNDKLHEVRTLQLDAHVRHCANVLQDTKLLAKLSNGDMVAIEAKYHVSCLTALYNQSRAAEKECGYDQLASVHGLAFAQLVEYIDEVQGDPVTAPVFKLAELAKMYESRLKQLGIQIDARINTTKLKERLLSHFPTMKAQTSGKQVLLVFDNDIGNALSSVCQHDSDVEGMHLAKAAQIIRRDIFNSRVDSSCKEFSGSFAPNCQESAVPESLLALVEMLLDGPSIEDQSNVCRLPAALSISQLIVYNSVKHTRSGTKRGMKTRHSVSQETPLPLYLAMMLHAETRKRELIDKLFSFGLCVSYDRLLQISASVANTAGKLYYLNCGLTPPTFGVCSRLQLWTTLTTTQVQQLHANQHWDFSHSASSLCNRWSHNWT